jgi:hypothetical protein
MMTATQVSRVNGIANEGNSVFAAQIVKIGPMITKTTAMVMIDAIAKIVFIKTPIKGALGPL